ncbi:MAG: DUF4013 domain-containing protein [bacterium]|nr:DUF4013 domain-containing protein [bacterium]
MDALLPFQFAFKDKEWGQKFVLLTILTLSMTALFALAVVFTSLSPILALMIVSVLVVLGLFPLCIILGYLLGIVRRVQAEEPILLPRWEEWDALIARGAGLLLVMTIYNIPLLLSTLTLIFVPRFLGNTNFAGAASLLILCCVLPFILVITTLGWLCLAVGACRYAKGEGLSLFFRPEALLKSAFAVGSVSAQWALLVLVYNIIFAIMMVIPCIGWMVYGAFLVPVHGHLLGQYGRLLNKSVADAKIAPKADKNPPQKPKQPVQKAPRPLGSASKRK